MKQNRGKKRKNSRVFFRAKRDKKQKTRWVRLFLVSFFWKVTEDDVMWANPLLIKRAHKTQTLFLFLSHLCTRVVCIFSLILLISTTRAVSQISYPCSLIKSVGEHHLKRDKRKITFWNDDALFSEDDDDDDDTTPTAELLHKKQQKDKKRQKRERPFKLQNKSYHFCYE